MKTIIFASVIAGSSAIAALPAAAAPFTLPSMAMMINGNTIYDNGLGDLNLLSGFIQSGSLTSSAATSDGGLVIKSPLTMDLSAQGLQYSAGTTVIKLTEIGLTDPSQAASFLTQFSGNFTVGDGTMTVASYIDASNAYFGTGTLLSTLSANTTPFALKATDVAGGTTPFSLTEILTINAGSSGIVSLDASVTASAVPEPASIALLGCSLIGTGLIRRRAGARAA